ncbi:Pentatricopeptide repeat-containing protein [Hirschfeldia incana]|nr:Pentatricopeptide repeat-containing protein [Hirschfeldia incana]KAJ0259996.1 Pentatricopeptide repeat-containing protein [Hirschfeldia incana]KAJ0259997.1 Pentatricopeptide repeat-containing protein [Hirschfeldia incana]
MTSKFMKLSGQFISKFTHVANLPAHRTDLVQRVSILKNELLATGNSKEKFESVLDQKGQWLFRSYRDGAGIVELMEQLFPLPHLALQVLEWRRRQFDCCIPLTTEEYAKGIKIAGRARDITFAVSLFNEAAKKRSQTTTVYNALMSAYMYNGLAEECQSVFRDFRRQTHCSPTVVTYNILISVYGRLLMVKNMEAAFEEMQKLNLSPNASTYNCMIAGYVTAWNWEKMEAMFREMKKGLVAPGTETCLLMLRGYANSGDLNKMEEMYESVKDQVGVNRGALVRAMICAYCKKPVEGRVEKIENLLSLLSGEEYYPWLNVLLIRLYAQEDILESMERRIDEAFEHNTSVNKSSIMRAITAAYFRSNEVDSLVSFVKRAESAGWKLCRSLYHCKIIMYGSQKRFEEMEGVVDEMGETNYGLVTKTFAIMVKAYRSHGMELNAERVMGKMLKHGCLHIPKRHLTQSALDATQVA